MMQMESRIVSFNIRPLAVMELRLGFTALGVFLAFFCRSVDAFADEFLDAVRHGNLDKVKSFVDRDRTLVNPDTGGLSPLHWAVADHHVDVAKFLLEKGADVNQQSNSGSTPIFAARTAKMAKLLLDHGAKFKLTSGNSTPLKEAVRGRHIGVVQVLLENGAELDFDAAVELGRTRLVAEMLAAKPWLAKPPRMPLFHSAGAGNLELTKLLLSHGADPDIDYGFSNISGPFTPLTNAVSGRHYEIAKLLLQHHASPNVSGGRNHDNLFFYAIAYLDAKYTKLMLNHGADLDLGTSWREGITALHVAAALGGAKDVSYTTRVGQPSPLKAAESQSLAKVQYLLDGGANAKARAKDGATPLLFAAIAGNRPVCELLLKRGASLDIAAACLLGERDHVERLLKATPALANTKRPLHTPPLHWAARSGDVKLVQLLLQHGAKIDARAPTLGYQDASGFHGRTSYQSSNPTALHVAASLGRTQVMRVLLDHGADINAKIGDDDFIQTASELVCYSGHEPAIKLLLARGAKFALDDISLNLQNQIINTDVLFQLLAAAGVNIKGPQGTELLAEAISNRNKVAVELLLARGAQPNVQSACTLGRAKDVQRILAQAPELVNAVQTEYPQQKLIEIAVQEGHLEIVKLLMERGAKPSVGAEPLAHVAARRGQLEILEFLLGHGSRLDSRDCSRYWCCGMTLLHSAAAGRRPKVAQFLISRGADVNDTAYGRGTPLHELGVYPSSNSYHEKRSDEEDAQRALTLAKLLIDAGANVAARNDYDETPLHRVANSGFEQVAELLLAKGADVNARDFRHNTPLDKSAGGYARMFPERNLKPMAELLRKHGGVH